MEPTGIITEDKAIKYDEDKPRPELIPPCALMEIANVYAHGAKKYAPNNWRKGMEWSRIYGAVLRHLFRFWSGQNIDPESGYCHLAHAAFGLLTLLEYIRTDTGTDDRQE